jgi:hypothetical protein
MIRTLQLAGVHSLVSLRLTVSRGYWLPRLTLAVIAGYMLLFSVRHPGSHVWTVMASFMMGFSCVLVARSELTSQTLPMPQAWIRAVNVLTQLSVCVVVALGFMMLDVATGWIRAISLGGGGWGLVLSQPSPHMLQAAQLELMALIVVASIPVGIAVSRFITHHQQPSNVLPNPPWQNVLPRWFGITALLGLALVGAIEFTAPVFAVRYLQAWLCLPLFFTATATVIYGWVALFPPTETRARHGKPAIQRLASTLGHSQAIKWSLLMSGLALYMMNPISLFPSDWAAHLQAVQPIYIVYATILPLFSMGVLTSGESSRDNQRFPALWLWKNSGWRIVPAPRLVIQRTLLLDFIGFAAASTVLLHTVCLLMGQGVEASPVLTPWLYDLIAFTWFFSGVTVLTLPAWVLFFIPRRRFGLGLAAVALAATLWAGHITLVAMGMDVGSGLPLKMHLMTMGSWALLGAIFWAQTASPTGRLFEMGSPTNRVSKTVVGLIGARGTRWSLATGLVTAILIGIATHRASMNSEIERINADRITAEQTDRLIADLQRIDGLNILTTTTRTRNAGVLLNPHIGLDDGTEAQDVAWWNDVKHKRMLSGHPGSHRKADHWSTAPDDIQVGDLSILTKLMAFDHWETGRLPSEYDETHPAQGPYEEYLRDMPHSVYLNHFQPYPNPVPLVDLAKFRLLHGLRTNDVLPALKEVRHLATLLHSDETMIHSVLAIAILRMERRAFDAAVDRGQLESTDWTVPTNADLHTMHRVAVSMAFVLSGGASGSQWRRIAALEFEPFGLCGAIHDAVATSVTQPNVRLWPGELLPLPDMGFLDHAISTSGCSNPLARNDHNLVQKARQGFASLPLDEFHRITRLSTIARLLSNEFDDSTILALTVPYLRGSAWMEIQANMHMGGILMYGDAPDADWNGARVRK